MASHSAKDLSDMIENTLNLHISLLSDMPAVTEGVGLDSTPLFQDGFLFDGPQLEMRGFVDLDAQPGISDSAESVFDIIMLPPNNPFDVTAPVQEASNQGGLHPNSCNQGDAHASSCSQQQGCGSFTAPLQVG